MVKASDVLFLFGGSAAVRDTLKSVKDDLKGNQIIVPVTKDGDIDSFQVIKQIDTGYNSLELLKARICPDLSCIAWMLFLTPMVACIYQLQPVFTAACAKECNLSIYSIST